MEAQIGSLELEAQIDESAEIIEDKDTIKDLKLDNAETDTKCEEQRHVKRQKSWISCVKIMPRDAFNCMFCIMFTIIFFPANTYAAPLEFPGYRPITSVTDFRNMQHNPGLAQYLQNVNNQNKSITMVQADHIGIKTFVHPIKFTIEEVLNGLDEACELTNTFMKECEKDEDVCRHVEEYIKVNERAIRGYYQVLSTFERVCTLEEYPSFEVAIARCKRGDHWSKFNPQFESCSFLNEAIIRSGTLHYREERAIFTISAIAIGALIGSLSLGTAAVIGSYKIANSVAKDLDHLKYISTLGARSNNNYFKAK